MNGDSNQHANSDVPVTTGSVATSETQVSSLKSSSGSGTTPSSADTVPTTQEISQSQEAYLSADEPPSWGALYPIDARFYPLELQDDVYTFGRGEDCSYSFDIPSIKKTLHYKQYSKYHFTIKRTLSSSGGHTVLLVDTSMNGVFVNGEKVPSKKSRQLCSKDEISLAFDKNKVLFFYDKTQEDDPDLPKSFNDKYIMHKMLGGGAFGEVRIAMSKFGVDQHAVKIINKQKTIFGAKDEKKVCEDILKEAKLMLSLHHPCIITVHDVLDSPKYLYIVLELAPGGDLYTRVLKKVFLGDELSKIMLFQMVSAVAYLHDNNVTHRDLKPENILMMSDEDECLVKYGMMGDEPGLLGLINSRRFQWLVIILLGPNTSFDVMFVVESRMFVIPFDFGVSRLVEETSFMRTQAGTPSYLAPELVKTMTGVNIKGYTKQVDSWSMGVMLFVWKDFNCNLLSLVGYPPFVRDRKDTKQDLLHQIVTANYNFNHSRWNNISEPAKDLVRKMLEVDPTKRFTPHQCLRHSWLNDDTTKQRYEMLTSQSIVSTPSCNMSLINKLEGKQEERSDAVELCFQNQIKDEVSNSSTASVARSPENALKRPLSSDDCHVDTKFFASGTGDKPNSENSDHR